MVSTNTVNVSGEVFNPGLIEFKKGKPVRYYLNKSLEDQILLSNEGIQNTTNIFGQFSSVLLRSVAK